jgi:poly-beta-1,6-N-acetyl-D-glucosamine synthase
MPNLQPYADLMFAFTFYYPLFMSYLWMAGAVFYWFHYERKNSQPDQPPELSSYPLVALVVPCYNEAANVRDTVCNLLDHNYPHFEVIAVNDGSSDDTGKILDELVAQHPRLRVIHQAKNQGKAVALDTAAALTSADYLVCIDGDALLDRNATRWMMRHFLGSPRVGAVTGNPRIRTRSTILGRIQVGEFSSIIGLIKRAQRTYGRIFTVSGVVAGFRKSALHQVGYWSRDMLTEDIDVSWKLQLNHWDVRFEPAALCWILMPETFKGLWRQRLRWAMGGSQTILKYAGMWKSWRKRRMWPVYVEYFTSMLWSYSMMATVVLWVLGYFFGVPKWLHVETMLPQWTGVIIGTTCLIQIAVSLFLDRRYDHGLLKNYYWTIWYPLAYWVLNMLTSVVALPKVLLRQRNMRARWVSPDRGITA